VTYAFVTDIPASWPRYEELAAALRDDVPEGLIVHVAGPTDEGVRIIDVWESEAAFQVFCRERLRPIVDRLGAAHEPVFRDLRAQHVLCPSGLDRKEQRP